MAPAGFRELMSVRGCRDPQPFSDRQFRSNAIDPRGFPKAPIFLPLQFLTACCRYTLDRPDPICDVPPPLTGSPALAQTVAGGRVCRSDGHDETNSVHRALVDA